MQQNEKPSDRSISCIAIDKALPGSRPHGLYLSRSQLSQWGFGQPMIPEQQVSFSYLNRYQPEILASDLPASALRIKIPEPGHSLNF